MLAALGAMHFVMQRRKAPIHRLVQRNMTILQNWHKAMVGTTSESGGCTASCGSICRVVPSDGSRNERDSRCWSSRE